MLFKVTNPAAGANPQVKDTEFKTYYPSINRSMEWCTLEPFVQMAEDQHIIPAIGPDFYAVLETEYQTNGTIADEHKAYTFRLLRTALAHYAVYIAFPQLNLRISDGGVNETSASDVAPVRQWVYNYSRWETAKQAYKYLDMALAQMESRVLAADTDYDVFKTSEAYTESMELLIPNARKFQRFYNLQNSRKSYTALRPYILKAEDIFLRPVFGDFFDEIKAQHLAGTLTTANAGILPYFQKLLAEYTVVLALPDLNFVNDGDGWRVVENKDSGDPMNLREMLQQLHTRAEQNAETFLIELKNILYADLDDYPTFRDSNYNELGDQDGDGIPDAELTACDDYLEDGAFLL